MADQVQIGWRDRVSFYVLPVVWYRSPANAGRAVPALVLDAREDFEAAGDCRWLLLSPVYRNTDMMDPYGPDGGVWSRRGDADGQWEP